jgi:hypothetical protein
MKKFNYSGLILSIILTGIVAIQCSDMGKNPGPDINDPPQITSSAHTVAVESEVFTYTATAVDPDGTSPLILYQHIPSWLVIEGDSLVGTTPVGAADTSFEAVALDGILVDNLLVSITIATGGVSYSVDIQPVFDNNCAFSGCHLAPGQAAGLQLDAYAHVMQGSQHGAVIIKFDANNSLLVHRLEGTITPSMPLNGTPLPDFTIQKIREWIAQGARNN